MSVFRSLTNEKREPARTADRMAADLALETCLRYKELREEAKQAERNIEEPKSWGPEAQECLQTIEALLKGRHRWVVVPIVLEHFPELVGLVKMPAASLIQRT